MWDIELTDGELPLKRQLYQTLRDRITSGRIPAGEALPSTRELAKQLAVSRNTVCEAYEMLLAEGYVVSRRGAPTRVAEGLVLERSHAEMPKPRTVAHTAPVVADLHTGQPDLRLFPAFQWGMAMRRACGGLTLSQLGYTGPQGLPQLREEISAWLFRSKGMLAPPEDIFITAGATHALHTIAQLLGEGGRGLMVEDPCHTGMLRTLQSKGVPVYPVAADEQGLQTELLSGQNAAAVYVTPSHQFPLGGILPAARRAALIRFAREHGLYIVEDDYDSEFRYSGEPVAPLFSADPQRVLYTGTFSKVLFPALRIGYAVVPKALQARFSQLRTQTDVQNPVAEQAALADFLHARRLDKHVRQMRKVYGERRQVLLNALREHFGDGWRTWGDAAGLHLALQFERLRFDASFVSRCRQSGIRLATVEQHSIVKGRHTDKLLIGYGHLTPDEIRRTVAVLAEFIQRELKREDGCVKRGE